MAEGKPMKQAVAIAMSMYKRRIKKQYICSMALFNNINRRIKSMQEGGRPFVMPEVDDGSIGGFNRPELRGLRKQARRGTLTNRERRRLNYLTNEAKGRRRRGAFRY